MRHFSVSGVIALAIYLLLLVPHAFSQTNNVGIGTNTPRASAILDVANPANNVSGVASKGIMIPTVNQIQLGAIESQYNGSLPNGLLVYETDLGAFWFYKYDTPVPLTPPFGSWYQLLYQQPTNTAMPAGGIIMWSGTNASIPAGWSLCDGSNGTPDLTDKFIVSVTSAAENPGTAAEVGFFVDVEAGATVAPDRRFFKLAYIMKL